MSTRDEAETIVRDTLSAARPPGNPLSFKEIAQVSASGKGRSRVILANLVMFDDRPAVVRLQPFQWGWSIEWADLPGGAISLEDGKWSRIASQDTQP